jgi:hypothetical protein
MYAESFAVQHETFACSFATSQDIKAYNECIDDDGKEEDCRAIGDKGVGYWGDSTVEGTGASCALPPEYMEHKWGSVEGAKHKMVRVIRPLEKGELGMRQVVCVLKDQMQPKNEAHIALNPDACRALGFNVSWPEPVLWFWVSEERKQRET